MGASSDFLPVSSPPRPFAAKRFSSLNSDDEPLFRPFDPHDIHTSSPISSNAGMNPFPSRAFLELSNPTTGGLFDHHMQHANPNGADACRHSTSSSSHRDHPHFDVLKSSSSSATTHRSQHGFSLDEPALHPMPSDLDRDFASRKHLGKMFDAELPRAHGRFFASKSRPSSMEPERLRGLRGVNALAESDEESKDTELALRRRRKFNASPGRPSGSSRRRQRRRQSKEDDVTITPATTRRRTRQRRREVRRRITSRRSPTLCSPSPIRTCQVCRSTPTTIRTRRSSMPPPWTMTWAWRTRTAPRPTGGR